MFKSENDLTCPSLALSDEGTATYFHQHSASTSGKNYSLWSSKRNKIRFSGSSARWVYFSKKELTSNGCIRIEKSGKNRTTDFVGNLDVNVSEELTRGKCKILYKWSSWEREREGQICLKSICHYSHPQGRKKVKIQLRVGILFPSYSVSLRKLF